MILAQREMLAAAQNEAKVRALELERLKLQLAKARRQTYGQSSERGKLLVEQLELAIEDLEETQAEEETKAEIAAPEPAKAPRRQLPVRRSHRPTTRSRQSLATHRRRIRFIRVPKPPSLRSPERRRGIRTLRLSPTKRTKPLH